MADTTNPSIISEDSKDPQMNPTGETREAELFTKANDVKSEIQSDPEAAPSKNEIPDENDVWWDGPDDSQNPMNWPASKKWTNVGILSFITLITPLASSMFAPGVPQVMKDFHTTSNTMATFVVSVYLLGFTIGPLLIAPLSEMYGRYPIYTTCNFFFVVFCVACALSKNMGMLIAFRFLHGMAGVAPLTIGAGSIGDMMPVQERGRAMAIWSIGPLLGPAFGPVAGGYLVEAKGWQWVFWLLAIISGVCCTLGIFLLNESYAPVLLQRKTNRLRKETGNMDLKSRLARNIPGRQFLWASIIRPTKMLIFSPICTILCVYTSVAYGILYLLFTTFTFVFEGQYGFSPGNAGLTYIPLGVGMFLSLAIMGPLSDKIIRKKLANGEQAKPEDRIPIFMTLPAALCLPIGLFLYGWTVQYKVHWIVPLIGTGILGFGLFIIFMCIQTYLIDAFILYAASATACNTVLRSLFGAVLPLCGLQMYDKLGLGWGNSLLGFVALGLAPVPLFFTWWGERIRTNPKFQLEL